jgi:hypothetical protein
MDAYQDDAIAQGTGRRYKTRRPVTTKRDDDADTRTEILDRVALLPSSGTPCRRRPCRDPVRYM